MDLFNIVVTVLVVAGIVALNIFPHNNIVTWTAIIATVLFVVFLYKFNKSRIR